MRNEFIKDIVLLYVEDDDVIRNELEYYLISNIQNVIIASNGKEGYKLYKEHKPDIIITDIKMNEMSGLEMSSLIREEDKTTPIIITSAYSDHEYLQKAIKIGINTFLLKPLNLMQLYCTLKITSDNIKLQRENEKRINELNETQSRLVKADKMANLGELVAGVTHEINTPIGVGFTSVSHLEEITKKIKKSYADDEMTQEAFESYLKSTEDLSKMIYLNLQRASKLISSFKEVAVDQTHDEKRVFKIKEYLDEVIFSLNYVIKKTHLEVKLVCDENLTLNSFPGAFSQVFTNFIMNSINHAYDKNDKGTILIEISKVDNKIKIIYSDDGKGISSEKIDKIFTPFYTTRKNLGGTGLGLSIVKDLVTITLKGSINCSSIENKGTCFQIELPTT